jgi:hypothetical protein
LLKTSSKGCIIIYRLRPEQLPTNPDRLWTGKILKVYPERENIESGVLVQVLDVGYQEFTEVMTTKQIVKVYHGNNRS